MIKKDTQLLVGVTLLAFLIAITGTNRIVKGMTTYEDNINLKETMTKEFEGQDIPNLNKIIDLADKSHRNIVRGYRNIDDLERYAKGKIEVLRLTNNIKNPYQQMNVSAHLINEYRFYPKSTGKVLHDILINMEGKEKREKLLEVETQLIHMTQDVKNNNPTSMFELFIYAILTLISAFMMAEIINRRDTKQNRIITVILCIMFVLSYTSWLDNYAKWAIDLYIL